MASCFDLINQIDLLSESHLLDKLEEYGHPVKVKAKMTDNQKLVNRKMLKHLVTKEFRDMKLNQTMIPAKKKGSVARVNLNGTFHGQSTAKRSSVMDRVSREPSPFKTTIPNLSEPPAKRQGRSKAEEKKVEENVLEAPLLADKVTSGRKKKASEDTPVVVVKSPLQKKVKEKKTAVVQLQVKPLKEVSPAKMTRSKGVVVEKVVEEKVVEEKVVESPKKVVESPEKEVAAASVGRKRGRQRAAEKVVEQLKEEGKAKGKKAADVVETEAPLAVAASAGKKRGRAKVTEQPVVQKKKARGRGRKVLESTSLDTPDDDNDVEGGDKDVEGGGNDAAVHVSTVSTQISFSSPKQFSDQSRLSVECISMTTGEPMKGLVVHLSVKMNADRWDTGVCETESDGTCLNLLSTHWEDRCKVTFSVGEWFKAEYIDCSLPIVEITLEKQDYTDQAVRLLIGPTSFSFVVKKTALAMNFGGN